MRMVLALLLLLPAISNAALILDGYEWSARTGGSFFESTESAHDDLLSEGWIWATDADLINLGMYELQLTSAQDEQLLGDFTGDCPVGSNGRRSCWLWLARQAPLDPSQTTFSLAVRLNHPDPYIDGSLWSDWVYASASYARLAYRPAAVPLPAAAWLFITGLVWLRFFRKRAE